MVYTLGLICEDEDCREGSRMFMTYGEMYLTQAIERLARAVERLDPDAMSDVENGDS